MSTAFCVVDARKRHLPIVYASESFSDLTGYANVDIIGKNCRFLQSPEGKVEQGSPRRFTDGDGVYHRQCCKSRSLSLPLLLVADTSAHPRCTQCASTLLQPERAKCRSSTTKRTKPLLST